MAGFSDCMGGIRILTEELGVACFLLHTPIALISLSYLIFLQVSLHQLFKWYHLLRFEKENWPQKVPIDQNEFVDICSENISCYDHIISFHGNPS